MGKLNWPEIWERFEYLLEMAESKECASCGHVELPNTEWEDQQKLIQRIVNQHVTRLVRAEKAR